MKRKSGSLYWGFFFIVISVVIFGSAFNLFEVGNSIFRIIVTAMLVAFAISNLKDLNYGGIIMPLIIAFALNDDLFYFRGNIWWLIWGGIFLSIGLHSLFPRKKHNFEFFSETYDSPKSDFNRHNFNDDDIIDVEVNVENGDGSKQNFTFSSDGTKEGTNFNKDSNREQQYDARQDFIRMEATFTDRTRYVRSENFTDGSVECNFASLRVYFDQAKFNPNGSHLNIDCNFGQIVLYIPHTVNVINNVTTTLGGISDSTHHMPQSGPTLTLNGDVSFGNLKIYYI